MRIHAAARQPVRLRTKRAVRCVPAPRRAAAGGRRRRSARSCGSARRRRLRRLPGFTSKNSPGTVMTFCVQRGAEEAHAVVERRRAGPRRCPRRRRCRPARGRCGCPAAPAASSIRSRFSRKACVDGAASPADDVLLVEQRNGRALQRPAAAAVEEAARAGHRLDHLARADRPRHAPARVAPVLGEAVEDAPPDRGSRPPRSARRSPPGAARGGPSRCSASRTRR